MEYYRNQLCATFEELTSGDDPVIKEGTLRQNVKRKNIECANRGGGEGNIALYVYSSMPEKYKQRFVDKYGEPEKMMRKKVLESKVEQDEKAEKYFEDFKYSLNGIQTTLSEKKKAEYILNAKVLNTLVRSYSKKQGLARALNNGRCNIWGVVFAESEELREVFGHTLPGSLSRLKAKVNEYKRNGYSCLLSGKLGNKNTLKVTEEGLRLMIALKRSKVPVYTNAQILKAYNERAMAQGWKPIKTVQSLLNWLDSPEVKPLWVDAVLGEQRSRELFNRRHQTELPTVRDALWYGDGTKLNLYYRDERGKMLTTSVYEVIDAATEVMLGYYISDTEDYVAQYHAYRMAIQVSGHKPYEIVHDNQGGHKKANSTGLLDKICRVHRTTAPYNGASKTIEQLFGQFQKNYLHKLWMFTGQNVTAKLDTSAPDIEFIEANAKNLPTYEEMIAMYAEARKEWNAAIRPGTNISRQEMYATTENPDTPAITPRDMIDLFWVRTKKPSVFTASGITITVDKKKYTYEVYGADGLPDHKWRQRNTLRRFIVEYDPFDMLHVRLYSIDKAGELRFSAEAGPYMKIHRALQDQTEGEASFIRHEQEAAYQDRMDRLVKAKEIEYEHGMAPEQHGLRSPMPKGLTKEQQMEIDRRTRRYAAPAEPQTLGEHTKAISLQTWDEIRDKQEIARRANGKF